MRETGKPGKKGVREMAEETTGGKQTAPRKRQTAAKTTAQTNTPAKARTPQKPKPKPKSRKGVGGRKPAWDELKITKKLDAVRGWTMQGATMEELGDMLGVSTATVYKWQATKPEFAEAVRAGRHVSNGELLNAAFKQSVGFMFTKSMPVKYKVFEKFSVKNKNGVVSEELKQVEKIEMVEVTEFVPPNANLLQFMLTNRLPDQYKKKEHVEHGGTIGQSDYGYMTDEELAAEVAALEKGAE